MRGISERHLESDDVENILIYTDVHKKLDCTIMAMLHGMVHRLGHEFKKPVKRKTIKHIGRHYMPTVKLLIEAPCLY